MPTPAAFWWHAGKARYPANALQAGRTCPVRKEVAATNQGSWFATSARFASAEDGATPLLAIAGLKTHNRRPGRAFYFLSRGSLVARSGAALWPPRRRLPPKSRSACLLNFRGGAKNRPSVRLPASRSGSQLMIAREVQLGTNLADCQRCPQS